MYNCASFLFRRKASIRSALILILSLCVVCGGGTGYATPDPQKAEEALRLKVEENLRVIKAVSKEEAADEKSLMIIRPSFDITKEGNVSSLEYGFGGVNPDYMGLSADDPYKYPYVMQIHVEALRRVFEDKVGGQTFWREHLESAERVVRRTVEDIESTPDRNNLDAKLSERSKEFQGVLDALAKSIKTYADNEKIQISRIRNTRFGPADTYSIGVLTDPAGGKVRVIHAFAWKTCLRKQGCDKERLDWRMLNVGGKSGLIGPYHFIAEWPDGGKDEGDIYIDREQDWTFRPFRR